MRSQRYPRHDPHRDYEAPRDQLKLQSQNNKHNVHHREQRLRDVIVEQYDDKESSQICGGESQLVVQVNQMSNEV
jgi:flagellar basal body-associated protein FliL